jgi:hypothetical protein
MVYIMCCLLITYNVIGKPEQIGKNKRKFSGHKSNPKRSLMYPRIWGTFIQQKINNDLMDQ